MLVHSPHVKKLTKNGQKYELLKIVFSKFHIRIFESTFGIAASYIVMNFRYIYCLLYIHRVTLHKKDNKR